MAGFKRVFGKEALVQFLKGLLKLGVVGAAMVMRCLAGDARGSESSSRWTSGAAAGDQGAKP